MEQKNFANASKLLSKMLQSLSTFEIERVIVDLCSTTTYTACNISRIGIHKLIDKTLVRARRALLHPPVIDPDHACNKMTGGKYPRETRTSRQRVCCILTSNKVISYPEQSLLLRVAD